MKCIKYKFKFQILFMVFLVISFLICMSVLMSFMFLEDFYIFQKETDLKKMYSQLQNTDGHSIPDEIYKKSESGNLNWALVTSGRKAEIVTGYSRNPQALIESLYTILYTQNELNDTDYVMEVISPKGTLNSYLQLTGKSADKYVIIQSPLESIEENVTLANTFYVIVGCLICLLSLIFIFHVLNIKTKPIGELVELSKQIALLNFDVSYDRYSGNEFDVLGKNINIMASSLENTIGKLRESNIKLQRYLAFKERADDTRKRLIIDISHELKTPLALIQGYAEGIQEFKDGEPDICEQYCGVIIDEIHKMDNILKKLFQLNQLEHDEIHYTTFDIVALIQEVISERQNVINQKSVEIKFEQQNCIYIDNDYQKIKEVITQYLLNAVQFAMKEKLVILQATKDDELLHISVFNSGLPIPEEEIEHIWLEFYKFDKARTRISENTGLGLAVVRTIAESIGGEYGVMNKKNGVEFWFSLKITPCAK